MKALIKLFLVVYVIKLVSSNPFFEENESSTQQYELKETCSLDVKGINIYQTIGKGERGYPGIKGNKGEEGRFGPRGFLGVPGRDGIQGEKGDKGYAGSSGPRGFPGPYGIKGDKGDAGFPGPYYGIKGEKGDAGLPGPRGFPSKCGCSNDPNNIGDNDDAALSTNGTDVPLPVSCKYAATRDLTGNFEKFDITLRSENPFEVECNYKNSKVSTCLKPKPSKFGLSNELGLDLSMTHLAEPFWLSERISKKEDNAVFNLKDFYFGYEFDQIEYLQKHSSVVTQKIRYFCKNSSVVPQDHKLIPKKALKLLTWKDQLIGPQPSATSPFHYAIDFDGCKDTDEWSHTDIALVGDHGRLPIRDFQIRDIRGGEQSFYIELLELCFSG